MESLEKQSELEMETEIEMVEAEQLDKFQKAEGAQKEKEINNGKEGGVASGQGNLLLIFILDHQSFTFPDLVQ